MNYLFFDIECADGSKAICEFGYVLTNEKFEIIKERNLIIDPECRFKLRDRSGQDDLELTYPYEYYYMFYPLSEVYETIKTLLTQENILIFGHAVNNDIGFLFKDCNRYKLPLFDFVAYDIQKMLPIFDKHNKKYTGLESAYKDLIPKDIRSTLKDHRAVDDSKKTMLVLKAMVAMLGFSPNDLIETCPKSKCAAMNYWKNKKSRDKDKGKQHSSRKLHKDGQVLWGDLYHEHKPLLEKPESIGKFITVSGDMKEHLVELINLISIIKGKGYVAYDGITGSDYLIVFDENNKEYMTKTFKYPFGGQVLTYNEFIKANS